MHCTAAAENEVMPHSSTSYLYILAHGRDSVLDQSTDAIDDHNAAVHEAQDWRLCLDVGVRSYW